MAELKPCPFCGGEMLMVYNSYDHAFKFYHKSSSDKLGCCVLDPIKLDGYAFVSLAKAAEAWNRRADNG